MSDQGAWSMPRISVVVPTYNRFGRLQSLLPLLRARVAAADGAIEVIVVDDGSTDETARLTSDLAGVRIVHQANGGPAAARNRGWADARADVVAFLDDDCEPSPEWPLAVLPAFDDPSVGGVGGPVVAAGTSALDVFAEVERLADHGRVADDGNVDYLVTANAAYRREALVGVGGFDPAFRSPSGEDVDLSWRLQAKGWRLVRGGAAVTHHHRSSVGEILRAYQVHGTGRAVLDARHPDRPGVGTKAGGAIRPSTLVEHWRGYREGGVSSATATLLVGLRVAALTSFTVGVATGRRRGSR